MFDELRNNDLVITNDKKSILKYLHDNKKILNLKIMSLTEFKDAYFGTYNEEAIYYLVSKYGYKYDIAKMHLDNFLFDEDLKKELEINNLIIRIPLFKNSIKRIVVINTFVDPFIQKEINKYENIKLETEKNVIINPVFEFRTIEDEISFICISILKLLKKMPIDKIKLVNVTDEYLIPIKRMFKFYSIPLNLKNDKSIYGTSIVKAFLNNLKEYKNIEKALEGLEKNEIHDYIIDICNKYAFKKTDNTIIYLIEQELKNKCIDTKKIKDAVSIVTLDEINDDDYYFILGFNQGVLPKIYKDEDYLSDKKKKELGILTSLEKNIKEKERVKYIITTYSNLTISYKLKSSKEDFYKSSLIEELNLEIKKINEEDYTYSNLYNKLEFAKKLDKLLKFNEHDSNLNLLYSNYQDLPYLAYDNKYKKIDNELFLKYVKDNLILSYSSIDNYYRCGFRYYINNILKLNKYEETFMTYIGNLFHYILSIAFKDNFDFEYEFNSYTKDNNFSNKESFFINKLKNDLLFTIDTIKSQDNYTSLNDTLYEQKIYVNKDRNIKITFMGIIDKLKYKDFDNKKIVAIIDYKTGNPEVDLNNLIYGISMQLPIYLYLTKNSGLKNVEIAGFYLQKIVHNKLNYQDNKDYDDEMAKLYRLEGYSNSDTNILEKFDDNYQDSSLIKGMKTSSKGFYAYSKVLNTEQMEKISDIVNNKIEQAISDILDTKFDINPKKIDKDLKGCEYCKFKDICYMKEEDIINLKFQSYKDFLGGDENA